jgi:hypothetical protein
MVEQNRRIFMGTWSGSITGNDTAQDLLMDYQATFSCNDVETALKKIDQYVRKEMFDETDEEEWCNYMYSLADYMWKKGILTIGIKNQIVEMIDSGYGLELWAEAGKKTLNDRKNALSNFRSKILSPQPPPQKIVVSLHTKTIFEVGDVVAFKLVTSDKTFTEHCTLNKSFFESMDGKYVLVRKVADNVSYTSSIEPSIKDIWPIFQLFDIYCDTVPDLSIVEGLSFAKISQCGLFSCEGSMFYFNKRKSSILGKYLKEIEKYSAIKIDNNIFFGINKPWYNADEKLIIGLTRKPDRISDQAL